MMTTRMSGFVMQKNFGFSLVEVLITLVLAGILAAFTVPQLFMNTNQANTKYSTMAHDAALMVTMAYERYKAANLGAASGMKFYDLAPYMNYVSVSTSTTIVVNEPPTGTWKGTPPRTCGSEMIGTSYCYRLHNGAIIWFNDAFYFGGTNSTNAIWFNFDPDGSGPVESLQFWLTYPGFVYTVKNLPATMTSGYIFSTATQSATTQDASWFNGF